MFMFFWFELLYLSLRFYYKRTKGEKDVFSWLSAVFLWWGIDQRKTTPGIDQDLADF